MLKRLARICGSPHSFSPIPPPSPAIALTLTIPPGAEPEIVFDHARDACEKSDVPDVPARAFRASDGTIRLIASHWTNRAMAGATLDSLRHPCDIVFEGGGNDDPAAFDDRGWIVSTYTLDGKTVHALVHNEFHGHKRPALCPSGQYMDCWYNTITYAVSTDGGRSFKAPPGPERFVAGVPYRYDPTRGTAQRTVQPVQHRPARRLLLHDDDIGAAGRAEGRRLPDADRSPGRSGSWRGWDGRDFTVRFADPYRAPAEATRQARHLHARPRPDPPDGEPEPPSPLGPLYRPVHPSRKDRSGDRAGRWRLLCDQPRPDHLDSAATCCSRPRPPWTRAAIRCRWFIRR